MKFYIENMGNFTRKILNEKHTNSRVGSGGDNGRAVGQVRPHGQLSNRRKNPHISKQNKK